MASDDALKLVLLLLAALLILPIVSMGLMMPMMGFMGGVPFGSEMWGMGLFGFAWLIPLGFIALLIYAGYRLVGSPGGVGAADDRAIETLREAYARGEIDEEEYDRRLEKLRRE